LALFEKVGAKVVGTACIIELTFLGGREKINAPFDALISYDE
jgi:adenine phosphoribosyltransferase